MSDETTVDERTGSEVVADHVASKGDGNSVPDEVWNTLMEDNKGMFDGDGRLKESRETTTSGQDDDMPTDPDSEDSEEIEETDDEREEREQAESEDEEQPEEPEVDEEDLSEARGALEALGLSKDQLEKMTPDQILAIGERVALQLEDRQSAQDGSAEEQGTESPQAFDFDSAFSEIESDMKDYLGDESVGRFKDFLKKFADHHEGRIARAQQQVIAAEKGQRVITESMSELEKSFPQLEGNERLRTRVLENVRVLAEAGRHTSNPSKLFRTAALMEGLREGKTKPKVSSRAIVNGQPTTSPSSPKRKTPKTPDAWEKQYLHLRHDKGMSDAAVKRQLGPRPRPTA